MATAAKKTTDSVEIVENDTTTPAAPKGELKDGVYTEKGVELTNGNKIDVSVITDRKQLPATYGSLLAEGNGPALTIATLTTYTRRMLDMSGATFEDLEMVLSQVIERSREAADSEDQ